MSDTYTDIPAFPTTEANYTNMEPFGDGMSIRDYFAAKAMQGLITTYPYDLDADYVSDGFPGIARRAYTMADAMMEAREA